MSEFGIVVAIGVILGLAVAVYFNRDWLFSTEADDYDVGEEDADTPVDTDTVAKGKGAEHKSDKAKK